MFIPPEDAKEIQKKLRDANGRFVKTGTPLQETTATTMESTGAASIIGSAVTDPSLDTPLISFQINNPFKKIFEWIKEIKKKQTTTFEFKVKVPLIALPIFLVVLGSAFTFFFNLNHTATTTAPISPTPTKPVVTPTPSAIYVSRIGTVKATYQVLSIMTKAYAQEISPQITPAPTNIPTPTFTPSPTMTPTPTPPPSRFVLLDKDEKVIYLISAKTIKLEPYLNKRVLIKGWYSAEKETLEIKNIKDIEILP